MSQGKGKDLVRHLLDELASGKIEVDAAMEKLRLLQIDQLAEFARLDTYRDLRKGVPEVVYAPRKTDAALEAICRRQLSERGLTLVSRLDGARAEILEASLAGGDEPVPQLVFDYRPEAGVLAGRTPAYQPPAERGCVGLLTAGTSDIPVAEEAALVAAHMGCRVERGYDVGVAGIHRLAEPLGRMIENGADVLIVVAGMEGALPSVVAGLVDIPVIGVPTSTGYGIGGDGTAALCSILQSCSPGLVAVNIDNGVGAGAAAALIARLSGR
jgi:NCAIR mutase (PurE)-related protein